MSGVALSLTDTASTCTPVFWATLMNAIRIAYRLLARSISSKSFFAETGLIRIFRKMPVLIRTTMN